MEAKYWDVKLEGTELDNLIARLNALAVDDNDHELSSNIEGVPKAKPC